MSPGPLPALGALRALAVATCAVAALGPAGSAAPAAAPNERVLPWSSAYADPARRTVRVVVISPSLDPPIRALVRETDRRIRIELRTPREDGVTTSIGYAFCVGVRLAPGRGPPPLRPQLPRRDRGPQADDPISLDGERPCKRARVVQR